MYSTTDELEAALAALAAAYPTTSTLHAVPHPTHDGRTAHVLRVGARTDAPDGVAVLGGVHAREWVPPELCVSLAADLLEAYANGTGLGYGGASFTAAEVHRLMSTVDLYVFACVNPDGRVHSQTTEALWRKNRRPTGGGCVGVDVNRNFDFLWDHTARFAADAGVNTSSDPCDHDVYRGPSAASEPETQNVVWLLDTFPIRWLVDVHSAVPVVLYSWGSDTDQTADTTQSFLNPALDAVRGRVGDAYGEYLTAHDLSVGSTLATAMSTQALAVRGTVWPVEQAMTLYPTSGASDDYSFSRHFADPARRPVHAWTIECGSSFQPAWSEAEQVAIETSAALLRFALDALATTDGLSVTMVSTALDLQVVESETSAQAVVLDVSGAHDVTLVASVTAGFQLPLGGTVHVAGPGVGSTTQGRVWVSWTAGAAGTTASGTATVRCLETDQEWVVPVGATSLPATKVAVGLVLDASASMLDDAGDGRRRVDVLKDAAGVFLAVVAPRHGVGLVRFDQDATAVMAVTTVGPEHFGPGRAAAQAAVAAHTPNPAGSTSIGDGVLAGQAVLAGAAGFDTDALVVLTDGQENAPAWIADVTPGNRTFAIGLGRPEDLNPAALGALVSGDGWVGVTGDLSVDERFLLAQYFLQALAGATNDQIVTS